MLRRHRLLLLCVPLLAGAPLAAQTPTLEQRVTRLEQQVQQLRQLHRLDSLRRPAPDTSLTPELRGNENLRFDYSDGRGTVPVKGYSVILHDNGNTLLD